MPIPVHFNTENIKSLSMINQSSCNCDQPGEIPLKNYKKKKIKKKIIDRLFPPLIFDFFK